MTERAAPGAESIVDDILAFLRECSDGKYGAIIDGMVRDGGTTLRIDAHDLEGYGGLMAALKDGAPAFLGTFGRVLFAEAARRSEEYARKNRDGLRVEIQNWGEAREIREIGSGDIHGLITVRGIVLRASEIMPQAMALKYVCHAGHDTSALRGGTDQIMRPLKCQTGGCGSASLELDVKRSVFRDIQFVRLQDFPEDMPPGHMPHHIDVRLHGGLINTIQGGDRVEITGMMEIEKPSSKAMRERDIYALFLTAIAIRGEEKSEDAGVSDGRIREMAANPNIKRMLIHSFAPRVAGMDVIKEAVMLLMVSEADTEDRGDINILLVGDPGVAKSEILKFCQSIAVRGIYTSGKSASAAGLTAAVVRDKNGVMTLEAGAVVLADRGILCVDEFDKMSKDDRSALHEVMEQQSLSMAKGGIVATLNARTSILAAANTVFGRYDQYKNVGENVGLPSPLLSRFDLIFVMRDIPSAKDEQIADHILRRHGSSVVDPPLSPDDLKAYLGFARTKRPQLDGDAGRYLKDFYLTIRRSEDTEGIIVTPRQLEGLVRLTKAHARLLLQDTAGIGDAKAATDMYQAMVAEVARDPETGKIDMGRMTGQPKNQIERMQLCLDVLKDLENDMAGAVTEAALVDELVKTGKYTEDEALSTIKKLANSNSIFEPSPGTYMRV